MEILHSVLFRAVGLLGGVILVLGFSISAFAQEESTANFACLGGNPNWKHTEVRDGVRGLIGKLCRETREGVEVEGVCGGFLDCDPKRYKDFNNRWVAIPEDKPFATLRDELRYAQARQAQADIDYPPPPPPRPLTWGDIFSALFQRPQSEQDAGTNRAANAREDGSPTYVLTSQPPAEPRTEDVLEPTWTEQPTDVSRQTDVLPPQVPQGASERITEAFGALSESPTYRYQQMFDTLSQSGAPRNENTFRGADNTPAEGLQQPQGPRSFLDLDWLLKETAQRLNFIKTRFLGL